MRGQGPALRGLQTRYWHNGELSRKEAGEECAIILVTCTLKVREQTKYDQVNYSPYRRGEPFFVLASCFMKGHLASSTSNPGDFSFLLQPVI